MNTLRIIITTSIIFFLATLFLALVLQRQFHSSDYWSVAFTHPDDLENCDFIITNNTTSSDFSYVLAETLHTVDVAPRSTKIISAECPDSPLIFKHGQEERLLRK